MIDELKLISICVGDQDRSLDFYTNKLGFKILTDQPFDDGSRWIELKIPKAETRLALIKAPHMASPASEYPPLVFGCQDVEKTYQELVKRGVEFVQPPLKAHWGTSALFKDPDGTIFCLSGRSQR